MCVAEKGEGSKGIGCLPYIYHSLPSGGSKGLTEETAVRVEKSDIWAEAPSSKIGRDTVENQGRGTPRRMW